MVVCIPTKGRVKTETYKLFEKVGIPFFHFIESKEMSLYNVPNKVDIGTNDKGIRITRNFILDWALQNNHDWIIMCDDDVKAFGEYENGKTIKKDAGIWKEIYEMVRVFPYELIGINYKQHAWHEKKRYSINRKFAEVCVLMNVSKIRWRYEEFVMKLDRQFCMQTIERGNGIIRFNHFWFECPNVGSNKGGLYNEYEKKTDLATCRKLLLNYPNYVKFVTKGTRTDVRIDLKKYALDNNKKIV